MFTGRAGLAAVGSDFSPAENLSTFDTQFGLIQLAGSSLSQTVYLAAGNYNVNFYAAGRGSYGTNPFDVYLIPNTASSPDNLNTSTTGTMELYANLDPPDGGNPTDWTLYNNGKATVSTAGYYTLDFLGLGGGDTTFLDDVTISTQAAVVCKCFRPIPLWCWSVRIRPWR